MFVVEKDLLNQMMLVNVAKDLNHQGKALNQDTKKKIQQNHK